MIKSSNLLVKVQSALLTIRFLIEFAELNDLPPSNEASDNIVKRGQKMPRKGYTPEQIINKLREVEVLIAQGGAISLVCKKIRVSDYTYYRWRKKYGRMRVDQAHRLKELEQENSRLKRLVADLSG